MFDIWHLAFGNWHTFLNNVDSSILFPPPKSAAASAPITDCDGCCCCCGGGGGCGNDFTFFAFWIVQVVALNTVHSSARGLHVSHVQSVEGPSQRSKQSNYNVFFQNSNSGKDEENTELTVLRSDASVKSRLSACMCRQDN